MLPTCLCGLNTDGTFVICKAHNNGVLSSGKKIVYGLFGINTLFGWDVTILNSEATIFSV